MQFAVTGGAGFIGSHIVKLLVDQGHKVRVIDNLHTGQMRNLEPVMDSVEFIKTDIRNQNVLQDALKDVDGIFHEAALTSVPESFVKPDEYRDVNVTGTDNVFKIAKSLGIKVVYASSSSVYGNTEKMPISEDAAPNPINPYARTKADVETIAVKHTCEGAKIVGLRYFNVYGRGQTGSYAGVITRFMQRLGEKKPPIINGTGSQMRDFVHVEDVARANAAAMKSSIAEGFFNIGTGVTTSIIQLAQTMIGAYDLPLEAEFADTLPGDVEKSQASTTLTARMLPWTYTIELKDGLYGMIR